MPAPTIVATGSTTAANAAGISKVYVAGETLTFSDPANPAPSSELWELLDAPPGQASALVGAATSTPTLVLDADFGTFRIRHTADGSIGELLFAVLTTGALAVRIPGYLEEDDEHASSVEATWNLGGNTKGWFPDLHALFKTIATSMARLNVAQQFTKNQHSGVVPLTDAATVNYVAADSNIFEFTGDVEAATRLAANPTGIVKGMTWQIWFIQPVAGGQELTFDTFYDWGDEGAPTFAAQSGGKINIITCVALSATFIRATTLKGE